MLAKIPVFFLLLIMGACAAPLNVEDVSFKLPSTYANHMSIDGLDIAIAPIDTEAKSKEFFSTDMKEANLLPLHLIVQNNGTYELEINSSQIFGITEDGTYTAAFDLRKAAQKVRESSIGTTAVTQTVGGAILGAAVGAAVGAGIGHGAGDSGTGAESGAIIGGAAGAAGGLNEGMSDSWTAEFKKELTSHAFENRVIYPGDIQEGFVYFNWKRYNQIRLKIFNINANKHELMLISVNLERKP